MESANPVVDFRAGWGEPPAVELVAVGPQKHGLILTFDDLAQGFASTGQELLLPLGKTVSNVWGFASDINDHGAVDPADKDAPPPYHSTATMQFLPGKGVRDYYDIEVVSRGTSWEHYGSPIVPENWTEIYTFKNGKYVLLRRTVLAPTTKPRKKLSH